MDQYPPIDKVKFNLVERRIWTACCCRRQQSEEGVINFYHDSPPAGHLGISNTFELAKRDFWWPNMKQDVEQYVKGCAGCQANKVNTRPLKPSLIPITPEHTLPFQ